MSNFENAKVLVKQGWLQGYLDGHVKVFKGIPYAAPPVGERRFRHPEDPGKWRGVRKATQYSAAAVQHVMEMENMPANVHGVPQFMAPSQYEEDCLYLNVWTPAKSEDDKLPVFI
ncbi:MAG: carboxylesterase family protein, partial [Erysipelotrichaceae bacterium]|nr:carboxylesterase family protein [Erysipelotrichaceae bacterium]